VSMAAGVNFLPWTGPMVRASASLRIPVADLFRPLIPVQIAGLLFVFGVAFLLGRRAEQRHRASEPGGPTAAHPMVRALTPDEQALRRPGRLWINGLVTIVILGTMVAGLVDPAVMFMLGTAAVLMINYPDPADQRRRVDAHAGAAMMMAGILLAAGAF